MIGPKSSASSSNPELRLSPRISKPSDRYFLSSSGRNVLYCLYGNDNVSRIVFTK